MTVYKSEKLPVCEQGEERQMVDSRESRFLLLTDKNSCLVLVDYQASMFKGIASSDKSIIMQTAIGAAKAASMLGIPVVLSTINPKYNGEFIPEIATLFPGQKVISRKIPCYDAFEDEAVWSAVIKTGRKKMVVSGLWTRMCFAYTALHGLKEGLEVYGLMDAAGDSTSDAHNYAIERMLQAGVIPVTLESLISDWMHNWGNPKSGEIVKEVYSKCGAMI